jgi:hypothetical protein
VEAPSASTATGRGRGRVLGSRASLADSAGRGTAATGAPAAGRRRTRAAAAPRTVSSNTRAESVKKSFNPLLGLATMSTAPSSSARMPRSVPRRAIPEQMTTGIGSVSMILRRQVIPSIPGMCTSSTTTSGRVRLIFSSAMSASAAVVTAIPPWARMAESTCRTSAESSTTRACTGRLTQRRSPRARSTGRRSAARVANVG